MPEGEEPSGETEVTIIDRSVIREYPPGEPAIWTSRVTYRVPGLPPSSLGVRLKEVTTEKIEELRNQISEKSGDLWKKYLKAEKSAIREDVSERRAARPEKYTV